MSRPIGGETQITSRKRIGGARDVTAKRVRLSPEIEASDQVTGPWDIIVSEGVDNELRTIPSTSLGSSSTHSGAGLESLLLGGGTAAAEGDYSVVAGYNAYAQGQEGEATLSAQVVIGKNARATLNCEEGVAIGANALCTGTSGIAIGGSVDAQPKATSSGAGSIAMGKGATASDDGAIAIGDRAAAAYQGMALGSGATTAHNGSIALGLNATTTAVDQLMVGGVSDEILSIVPGSGAVELGTVALPFGTVNANDLSLLAPNVAATADAGSLIIGHDTTGSYNHAKLAYSYHGDESTSSGLDIRVDGVTTASLECRANGNVYCRNFRPRAASAYELATPDVPWLSLNTNFTKYQGLSSGQVTVRVFNSTDTYEFYLPTTSGSRNSTLRSNGSGETSWQDDSAHFEAYLDTPTTTLASDANPVPINMNSLFTATFPDKFTVATDGQITYDGTEAKRFRCSATFSLKKVGGGGSDADVKIYAYKNIASAGYVVIPGSIVEKTINSATDIGAASIQFFVELNTGDQIRLYTSNDQTPFDTEFEYVNLCATSIGARVGAG